MGDVLEFLVGGISGLALGGVEDCALYIEKHLETGLSILLSSENTQ